MASELLGLRNVGDFYSQHYLSALLKNDLRDTLRLWNKAENDNGQKPPQKKLAALADGFFKALNLATGERRPARRLEATQAIHAAFLEALGYRYSRRAVALDDGTLLPLVVQEEQQGRPFLWVLETGFACDADDASPLDEAPLPSQLPDDAQDGSLAKGTFRELLDSIIFRQEAPPRWIIVLAGADVHLIDRKKWHQGQYLHFELSPLMSRREAKAFDHLASLLHRDVLLPVGGQSVLDKLDESSHKHAYAVSTDLKRNAQRAIEVLANEVMHYKRTTSKQGVFDKPDLERELTRECIAYLYRLLFLFYVEARGKDLGVVPMGADAYRLGYSLERLRDFELVPLTTVEAREGFYLHESLERLFQMVQDGYPAHPQLSLLGDTDSFAIPALRSQLFDPQHAPLLRGAKLRNLAMQQVIALLSLSDPEKRKARGRISYAELGINQLGAVYEGLLSYRGFFTQEDSIEVHAEGAKPEEGDQTYFLSATRKGELKDSQIVREANGKPKLYKKGTFVFRMAGRDREKSASYYTPEVLTECLTRYTLKERLEGLKADDILELTVCEPAMGSGAFLNEASNQLAKAYLERKQRELGKEIPSAEYQHELQKVKYHFAVHNCYGVDLNPLAVDLGKISLWLNVLHESATSPYLDLRIAAGNSLIGARRDVFHAADLTKKGSDNWLSKVPEPVPLGSERPDGGVYHFLLPDAGMVPFENDKVLKELEPESAQALKGWRKLITQPYSEPELKRLAKICAQVDVLWRKHLTQRQAVIAQTRRSLALWGQPDPKPELGRWDALAVADRASGLDDPAAPGQRLKTVMDYWCALWFWPLAQADKLPMRSDWLSDLEALLGLKGEANVERLVMVQQLADDKRFVHWELAFAEVFAERGGMDVILGNPPWRKVEWNEGAVLGDFDPMLAIQKLSAKQWSERRAALLKKSFARSVFQVEAQEALGTSAYLNSFQAYPLLKGVQTNVYKCFLSRMLSLASADARGGLIHQTGLFDDPKGGQLRSTLAKRLQLHLHFINKLLLFSEVEDQKHYELTILRGAERARPAFHNVSNLFHPRTLDESFAHDGFGVPPGIKTENGDWDLRGHRSRIVPVDEDTLALFARLYDDAETPALEARLPVVHSREILDVLRRFADAPRRLSDLEGEYFATVCFDETNAQKNGTIRRKIAFPKTPADLIVSGPHFYVANPLNKTPNEGCKHNQDYSEIDLTQVPDDYLPRTNYVPACSPKEYLERTPKWNGRPVTEFYRHVHRKMLAPTGERTLISAIAPPGPGALLTAISTAFSSNRQMALFAGLTASLSFDFFVKTTGRADLTSGALAMLPAPDICEDANTAELIIHRALRLNCLTRHYSALWGELCESEFATDGFAKSDARLTFTRADARWTREVALRTPFARRQALVELDALAALALGMTLDELTLIYRVQFPVLQQYERETSYDQRGKIVFTTNRGLSGVGLERKQWEEIKDAKKGDKLPKWAHDQQGPFEPPFDRCDREADMAQAYEVFQKRLGLSTGPSIKSTRPKSDRPGKKRSAG